MSRTNGCTNTGDGKPFRRLCVCQVDRVVADACTSLGNNQQGYWALTHAYLLSCIDVGIEVRLVFTVIDEVAPTST